LFQVRQYYKKLNRYRLNIKSLAERESGMSIADVINPYDKRNEIYLEFSGTPEKKKLKRKLIKLIAKRIKNARACILMYGAHLIKNGLSRTLIELMKRGYFAHLGTNGAGVIHDWELAYFGKTSEYVKRYIREGQFGIWNETGLYLNLAAILAFAEGRGFGEMVGEMVSTNTLIIPTVSELKSQIRELSKRFEKEKDIYRKDNLRQIILGKINLLHHLKSDFPLFGIKPGKMVIPHPESNAFYKEICVISNAYELGIPFTVHKGIGQDIIDTHPLNDGAAIGATTTNDFLIMGGSQALLEGGVYICIGSSVIAPMVFEKLQSMINNLRLKEHGKVLSNFLIVVNDIQPEEVYDREPPRNTPAYYHRFLKTFSRMGGRFIYFEEDNRCFLLNLFRLLV
jgi:hypothetical protein